jgi:hypothetical protein
VGSAVRSAVAVAVGVMVVATGDGVRATVATLELAGAVPVVTAGAVGVTRTICGVVPGLPGTVVTRALDEAVAAVSVEEDPDSTGAQAPSAANARTPATMYSLRTLNRWRPLSSV